MFLPADIVACNGEEVAIDFITDNIGGVTTYEWSVTGPEIGLTDDTANINDECC